MEVTTWLKPPVKERLNKYENAVTHVHNASAECATERVSRHLRAFAPRKGAAFPDFGRTTPPVGATGAREPCTDSQARRLQTAGWHSFQGRGSAPSRSQTRARSRRRYLRRRYARSCGPLWASDIPLHHRRKSWRSSFLPRRDWQFRSGREPRSRWYVPSGAIPCRAISDRIFVARYPIAYGTRPISLPVSSFPSTCPHLCQAIPAASR
ncbi:MAG: hypothetical protein JWO68_4061 [Actinomycetia bacterium]|nr:hypothetical protein [Actinomycetes bacterium]